MNIGILTCHRVHNYGALLQAYALLNFLKKKGHNVKIIDYWPTYRNWMYNLVNLDFKKKSKFYTFLHILLRILKIPISLIRFLEKFIRHQRFEAFICHFLKISWDFKFSDLEDMAHDCDLYIVGSDQVWRYYEFSNKVWFDDAYWGRFLLDSWVKKISYAASMGSIVQEFAQISYVRANIKNFTAVSVRESHLKLFLESNTSIEVEHVLDPAFLLDRHEWNLLINTKLERKIIKKKYVLCYNLTMDGHIDRVTKIIAHKFNLEIVQIQGWVNPLDFNRNHYQTTWPKEFLTLIKNAEFVVASSFHGVVFSIIFGKSFYAVGMENNKDRVISLLMLLGLANRYIDHLSDFNPEHIQDYDFIYQKLDIFIAKSKDFLESYLY